MTYDDIISLKGQLILESGTKEEKTEFCAKWARKRKLPALEGAEKQVAWAEVLRVERSVEWIWTAALNSDQELANRAVRVMRGAKDAKYWITARYDTNDYAIDRWEREHGE